jgi:hypothetical protein
MNGNRDTRLLALVCLGDGLPALTPAFGRSMAEAAALCLEEEGHRDSALLLVTGSYAETFVVTWPEVTDQVRACYNDPEEATEHGACGIAILLVGELVGQTVVERSRKGTGFDYWIGAEDELPFQRKACLEVSGIRRGDAALVDRRVREKLRQTSRTDGVLPAHVVVVEFSRPMAYVVNK